MASENQQIIPDYTQEEFDVLKTMLSVVDNEFINTSDHYQLGIFTVANSLSPEQIYQTLKTAHKIAPGLIGDQIYGAIFERPLSDMPLLMNKEGILKTIAKWRLKINK